MITRQIEEASPRKIFPAHGSIYDPRGYPADVLSCDSARPVEHRRCRRKRPIQSAERLFPELRRARIADIGFEQRDSRRRIVFQIHQLLGRAETATSRAASCRRTPCECLQQSLRIVRLRGQSVLTSAKGEIRVAASRVFFPERRIPWRRAAMSRFLVISARCKRLPIGRAGHRRDEWPAAYQTRDAPEMRRRACQRRRQSARIQCQSLRPKLTAWPE